MLPLFRIKTRFPTSIWLFRRGSIWERVSLGLPALGLRYVEACKLGAPDNRKWALQFLEAIALRKLRHQSSFHYGSSRAVPVLTCATASALRSSGTRFNRQGMHTTWRSSSDITRSDILWTIAVFTLMMLARSAENMCSRLTGGRVLGQRRLVWSCTEETEKEHEWCCTHPAVRKGSVVTSRVLREKAEV